MADNTILTKIKAYFTAASTRENLTSGEELQTSLGKIKKWFSDLGTAAFTNSTDYAAASHNQAANTITAMTGYSKPQSTSAIAATDTLNEAIGKLEKGLDGAGGGLQPGNVDVSTNSVTLTISSPTATVTLSNVTGTVSIISSGKNYNATLNNNILTISKTGIEEEHGIVLITVASNQNYAATTVGISVHNVGTPICTWSDGSDEEVSNMIQAAHNGYINLSDYWSVGDTRTVTNLDTSVISTSTISLRLYSGKAYDANDPTKISNFCIGTEGTVNMFPSTLSKTEGSNIYLSFEYPNKILNCLPQSLINNLLLQTITNIRVSDGGSSNYTQDTLVSYFGDAIHTQTNINYVTNTTSVTSGSLYYRVYYYYSGNWSTKNILYSSTAAKDLIKTTYRMCI